MFTAKYADRLGFVSRQLAGQLPARDLETALKTLEQTLPQEYAADVQTLRSVLKTGGEAVGSRYLGPWHALRRMIAAVPDKRAELFARFHEYLGQNQVLISTYWAGVVSIFSYLAAISSVALVVAYIFATKVIPSFAEFFGSFRAELPFLTRAVFEIGSATILIGGLVLLAVVAAAGWATLTLNSRIRYLEPLPNWPGWVPLISGVSESYNNGLFINIARILRESGAPIDDAIDIASLAANKPHGFTLDGIVANPEELPDNSVLHELAYAKKLGTFDSELQFQCDRHLEQMTFVLANARDRIALLVKTVLFVFVATLVVAMYLPIFKMGSVI